MADVSEHRPTLARKGRPLLKPPRETQKRRRGRNRAARPAGESAYQGRLFGLGGRETEHLCVLSNGMGQDSTAILLKLLHDEGFRERYAPGRLWIVASDPGGEEPETYEHARRTKELCEERGEDFVLLTPEMGFHPPAWPDLIGHHKRLSTIGSKAFPRACTQRLKISPVWNYVNDRLAREEGHPAKNKGGLYGHLGLTGTRVRCLIGISAEEADRRIEGGSHNIPRWMERTVERSYPLRDLGMTRRDCQEYIVSLGYELPPPSACRRCHYKGPAEILLLARSDPDAWQEWVEMEAAKLRASAVKFPDLSSQKNLPVSGRPGLTLPEVLRRAEEEFGHLSTGDLKAMRMRHGHGVASRY